MLVNCAGTSISAKFEEVEVDRFKVGTWTCGWAEKHRVGKLKPCSCQRVHFCRQNVDRRWICCTDCIFVFTQKLMEVNYLGSVYPTRAVITTMKERRMGRIMFVSSQAGQIGLFGYTAYSPTKFALRGLAESLQMEVSFLRLQRPIVSHFKGICSNQIDFNLSNTLLYV